MIYVVTKDGAFDESTPITVLLNDGIDPVDRYVKTEAEKFEGGDEYARWSAYQLRGLGDKPFAVRSYRIWVKETCRPQEFWEGHIQISRGRAIVYQTEPLF